MELKDKFWKFASVSNATDTLENIFIKWAGKEKLSINEFNTTYVEVNNQVNEYFRKTATEYIKVKVKDENGVETETEYPKDVYLQLIKDNNNQQQSQQPIPQETNLNQEAPVENNTPIEEEPMEEDIAQQPLGNDSPVGQEDFQDESIAHVGEDLNTSQQPNAEVEESIPEEKAEESPFPLLDILGS